MANKDLRIELLQDRENAKIGEEMLWNSGFATSAGWTTPTGTCSAAFDFPSGIMRKNTTGNCARASSDLVLVEGNSYTVKVAVRNYNRGGNLLLANHATNNANVNILTYLIVPYQGAGTGSDWGVYEATWVQGPTYTDKVMVYAGAGAELELGYLRIYRAAVDKSSVFGVLDATTTEDFPLSLTFSVNDPSNIDARKGAYSKTFQIPATANNNKVFKNYNIANSTHHDAPIHDKIECRILVGNLFSLRGLLQLQNVERLNDKPISYSCVFLGDNLAWSTLIETKYLSDLQLDNSTNLELSAEKIIKSWEADNAISTTTRAGANTVNTIPVVYPLVSYGRVNETGWDYGNGFQLFRKQWEVDYFLNNTYNTAQTGLYPLSDTQEYEPVNDWRPLVWIYNMIHKIFNDIGYKVSSAFIETDNFKKLLYATPNFLFNNANERKQANTYIGNFKDDACAASQTNLKFFNEIATWSFTVPNQSSTFTQAATFQTPYFPLQFKGTCGSCTTSSCGSGRFRPDVGVITTTAGTQQDILIEQAGTGIPAHPYFNRWTIAKAGYYAITTENIMFYFTWDEADWSGSGDITGSATSGMTVYGNIVIRVLRVGGTTNETISFVDNEEETALSGFKPNNADYHFRGNLPPKSSVHYFNAGDKVSLIFGVAPIVKVADPAANYTGTTDIIVRTQLYGTTENDWDTQNGAGSNGLVSITMVNEDIPAYGGFYDLQDVLPNDQKQLDLIKGIAHSFNLQFYTEESSRTVYIEPFNDFYLPPRDAIDWTHKLARNLSDVQRFAANDFKRRVIFKYKTDDKDWRVKQMGELYFDGVLDNYPKILDLGTSFPSGDTIFENPFFAGTYDSEKFGAGKTLLENTNFYTASLWKASYWHSSTKGYEFKPRMLYYNKMNMPAVHNPLWQGFRVQVGSTGSALFQAMPVQISDLTTELQTFYTVANPYLTNSVYNSATFINRHDYTNQFGLSYGNYWAKDYDSSDNSYTSVGDEVGQGLYHRYYKPMIEGLVGKPKTRECYMDLKITDIIDLNFRKMVYLDGVYYRLVKILDYQPHKNVATKVQLHPWSPNVGDSVPTQGVWINNTSGFYPGGLWGGAWEEDGPNTDDPPPAVNP